MPKIKMKTNSSVKKRFRLTATGRIKRKRANLRHNVGSKSSDSTRKLRKGGYIDDTHAHQIHAQIPYGL